MYPAVPIQYRILYTVWHKLNTSSLRVLVTILIQDAQVSTNYD